MKTLFCATKHAKICVLQLLLSLRSLTCCVACVFSLSACSSMSSTDNFAYGTHGIFKNRDKRYLTSQAGPTLNIPAGLNAHAGGDDLIVPPLAATAADHPVYSPSTLPPGSLAQEVASGQPAAVKCFDKEECY